ncbi:MAG: acyl carrier protein [Sphingomonadales bacterium]
MSNLSQYKSAFVDTFRVPEGDLATLAYQSVETWDSLGHMQLMTELEEKFDVELDIDDIVEFSSFVKGKEILGKYGVALDG